MPKNKKSLLQALKDTINSFQDVAETEEEQKAVENIQDDVEELEETAGEKEEEDNYVVDLEEDTENSDEEQIEEEKTESYSIEEAMAMLDNLALSEDSLKEASEFIATLPKETADKLIPLLKKVLDETTATSIKTLLSETKSKKVTTSPKKTGTSLGQRMAAEANKRKGA
ncbi:hypothetical protein [Lactococcus ileimucosae]|uniref:hypothetical protein n=1 Tax=Lactococcus ileimucosae TaxID=2941329 RepID=UPI0020439503|nr:hypothetical protein [Lactococcus ileimucosae]